MAVSYGSGFMPNRDIAVRVRPVWNGHQVRGYEVVQGNMQPWGCVSIYDDFLSLLQITAALRVSPPSGLSIIPAATGAVTVVSTGVSATEKACGVLDLAVSAVADSVAATHSALALKSGLGRYMAAFRAAPNVLSTGAQEFACSFGFSDNFAAGAVNPTNDGCLIRYDRATDGDFWSCVTTVGGAATKTVTTVAPVAATFQTFEVDIGEEGTFVCYRIDGVPVAQHAISAVTGRYGCGFVMRKTVGATQRDLLVDAFRLDIEQRDDR